ncbi:uncharacterized protein LOC120770715 [Bactrocera tryoni]|uniref:uncharacterized protein LOC120770715 n=1 Tax=Bactrocera tryoni TaxID=59916 RepID=UPI001A970D85|nr:uncharacterized protein LOC120770715 [Bactrocera tryoni]
MDVKNGAAQLDELFDVMKSYRRNWLIAENERRRGLLSRRITTPEPTTSKRRATSPVEPRETMRPRSEKDGQWQKVLPKKAWKILTIEGTENKNPKEGRQQGRNTVSNQRAKSRPKRQSEAVIIKPAEGNSYAEVLKNISSKVNLREAEVKIKGIRKTRAGALLLELEKGQFTKASFCEALKTTLRESASQYKKKERGTWLEESSSTAAIWLPPGSNAITIDKGNGNGFVWAKCDFFTVISCYLTPSDSIQEFQEKLDNIEDTARSIEGQLIIAGDINSNAVEWGMPNTDSRGKRILEMAARLSLIVLNTGNATTFRRPGCEETTPDITLSSERLAGSIKKWKVLEDYTGSDHQYISFTIDAGTNGNQRPKP